MNKGSLFIDRINSIRFKVKGYPLKFDDLTIDSNLTNYVYRVRNRRF